MTVPLPPAAADKLIKHLQSCVSCRLARRGTGTQCHTGKELTRQATEERHG